MKTRKASEQLPEPPFISAGQAKSNARKLHTAIETVFRLTHRRDMTTQERLLFGLPGVDGDHSRGRENSSADGHFTKTKRRR
jgi:hypothetical protein